MIPNVQQFFALPRSGAPQILLRKNSTNVVYKSQLIYLLVCDMWFINHSGPVNFFINFWLVNYNLRVKHRGDFGTFCCCLVLSSREEARAPKPKVPHLFLPKPGCSRARGRRLRKIFFRFSDEHDELMESCRLVYVLPMHKPSLSYGISH